MDFLSSMKFLLSTTRWKLAKNSRTLAQSVRVRPSWLQRMFNNRFVRSYRKYHNRVVIQQQNSTVFVENRSAAIVR